MTDTRQMLEAAARAAGHRIEGDADKLVVFPGHKAGGLSIFNERGGSSLWNPLNDDGDALRLAVKLKITPHIDNNLTDAESHLGFSTEAHGDNPYAATRLAIVRAAAAIGSTE